MISQWHTTFHQWCVDIYSGKVRMPEYYYDDDPEWLDQSVTFVAREKAVNQILQESLEKNFGTIELDGEVYRWVEERNPWYVQMDVQMEVLSYYPLTITFSRISLETGDDKPTNIVDLRLYEPNSDGKGEGILSLYAPKGTSQEECYSMIQAFGPDLTDFLSKLEIMMTNSIDQEGCFPYQFN